MQSYDHIERCTSSLGLILSCLGFYSILLYPTLFCVFYSSIPHSIPFHSVLFDPLARVVAQLPARQVELQGATMEAQAAAIPIQI